MEKQEAINSAKNFILKVAPLLTNMRQAPKVDSHQKLAEYRGMLLEQQPEVQHTIKEVFANAPPDFFVKMRNGPIAIADLDFVDNLFPGSNLEPATLQAINARNWHNHI